jgi:hypothetical protein
VPQRERLLGRNGELVVGATYEEDPVAFPINALVIDLTTEDGGEDESLGFWFGCYALC